MIGEHRRTKSAKLSFDPVPASAGGLNKTSRLPLAVSLARGVLNFYLDWDLEIRKRFAQPLASESGEFPDTSTIESRMLPICYETGLTSGHTTDAAQFMSVATETFVKQVLSQVFDKTRSNGPGSGGSAGSGGGSNWIMTHKYRIQLEKEEEIWSRGEVQRDKSGLLPIEAKAASERGPLGMADFRTALEMGDCGIGQMPIVIEQILFGYREGELEEWEEYSFPNGYSKAVGEEHDNDVIMGGISAHHINSVNGANIINGTNGHLEDDLSDADGWGWEGTSAHDRDGLNSLLDSCLAVGS